MLYSGAVGMTRPQRWDVRIAPDVEEQVRALARRDPHARFVADIKSAMALMIVSGTRATGVKKLRGLDLWEIRISDHRAFFCPVRGTSVLAVGALEAKKTEKFKMTRLRAIERRVHHWRDNLEETP
jgi:hypothetical protein